MNFLNIEDINTQIGYLAKVIEVCGVLTIILGSIYATVYFFKNHFTKKTNAYDSYRGQLGKAILLGLEIMVAGDIIGTVAVEPTFKTLGALALVVIIRTFLSFSLEVEIKGHWPWSSEKFKGENYETLQRN